MPLFSRARMSSYVARISGRGRARNWVGVTALGSVVAFFYYAGVARKMWFHDPAPEAQAAPKPVPAALSVAIGLCVIVTVVVGVYPQIVARIGELAFPT